MTAQRCIADTTIKAVEKAALGMPFQEAVTYLQTVLDGSFQFNYQYASLLAKENPHSTLGVSSVHFNRSRQFGGYQGSL